MVNRHTFLVLLFLFSFQLAAQNEYGKWLKPLEKVAFKPILQLQFWGSFSHDHRVLNDSTGEYEPVEDRLNVMIRRARLGFQIKPYAGLTFRFISSFDFIGRDLNAAHTGGTNTSARPNFDIWEARLQWQVFPEKELLYLNAGWIRPNFSRESLTSPWKVSSMEKAWSMNYTRRHLVGLGPGAAPGINVGGLAGSSEHTFWLGYNASVFVPQYISLLGNSNGINFSPLFVGRAILHFGQPESTTYQLGSNLNAFSQRKGLSVGIGGAWQGKTDLFTSNYGAELDFLFNWGPFNLDGDFNFLWRQGEQPENGSAYRIWTTNFQTGHIRSSVNLTVGKFFLEPVFMFVFLNGPLEEQAQEDALEVLSRYGIHHQYDIGLNWYLNRNKLKLVLHYLINTGNAGETDTDAIGNNYLFQANVGPIQRGNWLGLGLNLTL